MTLMKIAPLLCIPLSLALQAQEAPAKSSTHYSISGDAVTRLNGDRFNNRPLYCLHQPAFAMGGDRPLVSLANNPLITGTFMAAVVRDGKGRWFHQFTETRMLYRPGRLEWQLSDPSLPGLTATLELVTMDQTAGMVVRLDISGAKEGDRLLWSFGGARLPAGATSGGMALHVSLDPNVHPETLQRGFLAEDCANNQARIEGDVFQVALAGQPHVTAGRCDTASRLFIADAAAWPDPATLLAAAFANPAAEKPLLCGVIDLPSDLAPMHWAIEDFHGEKPTPEGLQRLADPAKSFEAGLQRAKTLAGRVVADTPFDWLDTAISAVSASIDATYYPPVYVHGGMAWNVPYPGWRTTYGPIAYGWHENIKAQIAHYIASQTTTSEKRFARAEPTLGYGQQAKDSRFYGKGRIQQDNGFYNFQTQFFDQAVYAWRATGDPELEKILFPALELQLEWARDCFDPDGDGLYESYINTWPTDSVWFNGGGSPEESSYAYTGHRAASEMARRAGDAAKVEFHQGMAEKIRKAMLDLLWVKDRGHVGSYREQLGLKRLHGDAWLYGIFLPIDAGILPWAEAAQALHYTEWGLERQRMPFGGQRCWTSNWVPSMWSAREMFVGDNHHLALAYYQSGLPEAAWELLQGTTLESMFNEKVPGAVNAPNGGTDFNDASSMFGRVIVEGLFGYKPDYPNGTVSFRPGLPGGWDQASIRTPDFSLRFKRSNSVDQYDFTVRQTARLRLELPVHRGHVKEVRVDGKPAKWEAAPGIGRTMVAVETDSTQASSVAITWSDAPQVSGEPSIMVKGNVGDAVKLAVEGARVIEFMDPQEALLEAKLADGAITAKLNGKAGHHLVLALAEFGNTRQWRQFKIEILDPAGDAARAAQTVAAVPAGATWKSVDVAAQLNGDIRTIFKQQYLSPRPETSSLRIGSDGYSPWTFYYWGIKPPEIDLAHVPSMMTGATTLIYEAADDALLDVGDEVTLEAWVKAGAMSSDGGRIIDKCRPGTFDGYMLDTYPGNSLRLHVPNGGCGFDAKLPADRWTHVAGVYSASKRISKLYIDGREVASNPNGNFAPLVKNDLPLRIGADAMGANRFKGSMRRVAVHGRALAAGEIASRAQGGAVPDGCIAEWNLESGGESIQPVTGQLALRRAGAAGGFLTTPQGAPFDWPGGERNIAFTSQWDNWPRLVTVPVDQSAEAAWFLVCGSTNPMQGRIANGRLVLKYADGIENVLELVPPFNYWNLCSYVRADYDYQRDAFCLPKTPPPMVQLGINCRAMVLNRKLRPGVKLESVTLETLSQEVVIGLMGVSLMNPQKQP